MRDKICYHACLADFLSLPTYSWVAEKLTLLRMAIMASFQKRVSQVLITALSIFMLTGCGSNQQARWRQEKLELQEKVAAQQEEIDTLKKNVDATTDLLFKVGTQLRECQGLSSEPTAEKKENPKIATTPKPRKVSTTRTPRRPRPKTSKANSKGGCPCKAKRTTAATK